MSHKRALRMFIREELTRQYLIEKKIIDEGFSGSIKNAFRSLGEKIKSKIVEKAKALVEKISSIFEELKGSNENKDEQQAFLKQFEKEEGGMSPAELLSKTGLGEAVQGAKSEMNALKGEVVSDTGRPPKNESVEKIQLEWSRLVSEHNFLLERRKEALLLVREDKRRSLNESVIATVAGTWWAGIKIVVGTLGMIAFTAKGIAWVLNKLGKERAAETVEHFEHKIHEIEKYILKKMAFPDPVLYASYRALRAIKGRVAAIKGKSAEGDALTFEQFKKTKVEKDAAYKSLHAALIGTILVSSIGHIVHALKELGEGILHGAESVGGVGKVAKAGYEAVHGVESATTAAGSASKAVNLASKMT